jgi:hypothetical protein
MKHYKDPNTNEIYAYEADGSQDAFIKPGLVAITVDEVNSIRQAKSQSEFNAMTYSDKRRAEYPDFRDYLDGIVKGDQAQVQAYIDACLAVKAKYPKE